ncbi:unnamed protein product [Staurois parvus]|uniref:Uncharacterized protein n=1 Tax=Staurois parvus TaxID=386267 RepID=A0ABN9CPI3_9NEOB|nr:unnamed protein product [Staurois parvus]
MSCQSAPVSKWSVHPVPAHMGGTGRQYTDMCSSP